MFGRCVEKSWLTYDATMIAVIRPDAHCYDAGCRWLGLDSLWCNRPKHRYFCTTEIEAPKFPLFLIPLVKTLLFVL